jgi:hypothetical protein
MKPKLLGGLGADDAQQLMVEVQLGIPASHSKLKMNPQVRAFRARLVSEMADANAKGWFVQFTPEFVGPSRSRGTRSASCSRVKASR